MMLKGRRDFILSAAASAAGLHASTARAGAAAVRAMLRSSVGSGEQPAIRTEDALWVTLDAELRSSWQDGLSSATEEQIRKDESGTLLFLPFPYLGPTGRRGTYSHMFAWDSDFISWGLLRHNREDLVRNHILNYLFMVERFGFMPNSNDTAGITRSQTPLLPETLWRYYLKTQDISLLYRAYPLLKLNYEKYWTAEHHLTPTGLSTNRDLGDPNLPPELAAEAETGLDWTPIFAGDVRRCTPLITNCALVRYEKVIAKVAQRLGDHSTETDFLRKSKWRSALIRKLCWNEDKGVFLEYDFVRRQQLPYISDCVFWPLWAGVATQHQARRVMRNVHRLEQPFGLSSTDVAYRDSRPPSVYGPHMVQPESPPELAGGGGPLMWMYPAGWAPMHIVAIHGMEAYGFRGDALRIANKFLSLLLRQYQRTGQLWEKYNVVDGTLVLPNSRYGNVPMRGWTAAAVILLGQFLFGSKSVLAP